MEDIIVDIIEIIVEVLRLLVVIDLCRLFLTI